VFEILKFLHIGDSHQNDGYQASRNQYFEAGIPAEGLYYPSHYDIG